MAEGEIKQLDSVTVPLEGMNLVEAAAGTGKTYNIQNLVVRMLLEKGLKISQIAVLSFSNEAAAELMNRIRRVLERVLAVLEKRTGDDLEQAEALVARDRNCRPQVDDKARIAAVKEALQDVDIANISTINGFCQKLLHRFAFESGTTFSSQVDSKPQPRVKVILDDWMRSKLYAGEMSSLYAALIDPKEIYRLQRHVLDLDLENPEIDSTAFFRAAEIVKSTFKADETLALLSDSWFRKNGVVVTRKARFEKAMRNLDWSEIIGIIKEAYNPEKIKSAATPKFEATVAEVVDTSKFFQACGDFLNGLPLAVAALKHEALIFASDRFEELKQSGNFMTFADQIHIVDKALQNSDEFKKSLRSKLKAGIIDEFQDTDAAQYRIFKTLFDVEDGCVFLVGDPRQAIYRFRGGDINAYLTAKAEILAHEKGNVYRLGVNYRSSVNMVEAVNRIFAVHPDPFGTKEISFPNLASRAADKAPELLVNGKPAPEALIRYQIEEGSDSWLHACVKRISYLLSDAAAERFPDGSRITPGDIAVLLRSKANCRRLRQELEKFNIPAVCLRNGNVYAGSEASDLYIILDAVLAPANRNKVHSALATGLCDMPLAALDRDSGDQEELNVWREVFFRLRDLWRRKGFIVMFETLLNKFNIREKLAVKAEGERRLTNLLQLEELLQQQSVMDNLSPERLLSQFAALISASADKDNIDEEHEELMSSDSSCVRIMTIHASKGLQFPIVLIPGSKQFAVLEGDSGNGFCTIDNKRTLNLDNDPEKKRIEHKELYDEMCRLIYVAITRAEYRCEMFEERNVSGTVWHYLLPENDLPLTESSSGFSSLSYKRDQAVLKSEIPQAQEQEVSWNVISYTALTDGIKSSLEDSGKDHDEDGEGLSGSKQKEPGAVKKFSPFTLAGGTGFGNIIHSYLETADFASSLEACEAAAAMLIEQTEVPDIEDKEKFTAGYGKWLHDIFNTPIEDWQGGTFTLASIGEKDRLMELEFCCSMDQFRTSGMSKVIDEYISSEFGKVNYPAQWDKSLPGGILNGFIDMVFRRNGKYYIVDWKTNILDSKIANFQPGKLAAEMVKKMYFVQYLLYMVALVRHLRRYCKGEFGEAEYEQMIGGVYYFFVRGMSPDAPGRGVFRSRPPWKTVCELEEMLCLKM